LSIGAATVTGPSPAANQLQKPRIVTLAPGPPGCPTTENGEAFRRGLKELGYDPAGVDRHCYQELAQVLGIVRDLAKSQPRVMAIWGSATVVRGLREATATLPVVLVNVSDPVRYKLADSLSHPGGNLTGLATMTNELMAKRAELLKEVLPRATRVGVLGHRKNPQHAEYAATAQAAARALKMDARIYALETPTELPGAFAAMERDRTDALVALPDSMLWIHRAEIVALARRHRLPDIYAETSYVELGGLLSYATDLPELSRRAATYVDKILKGAQAGDLPFEQPTKFDLVINADTARALGVTVPPSLLLRASRVIDQLRPVPR